MVKTGCKRERTIFLIEFSHVWHQIKVLFEADISLDIGCKEEENGGSKKVNYFIDTFSETTEPKNLIKIIVVRTHAI